MNDDLKYDMTIPKLGAFEEYMQSIYGGMVQGGFDIAQLRQAYEAGWEQAVLEHC